MAYSQGATVPNSAPVFHPTVWGDFFIDYSPEELQMSEKWMTDRSNQLKENVLGILEACSTTVDKLNLVDTLQHLNVFNKFKDEDGAFNVGISNDPRGLLSLYNASYLLTHGETELEESILFAREHLESMESDLKPPLAEQVRRSLHLPLPKTLKRVEAMHYMSEYKYETMHNSSILELAKLDFNLLQRLHLKELKALSRWEESAISLLPEYLKNFYLKLISTFKEFEDELKPDEKYRVSFSIKAFQILSINYLQEAEWSHHNYKPIFNDQVEVSSICSGAPLLCVGLFVGMGDSATKEVLEWALGCTDAVKASAVVTRLMNDLASFKRGKNKNDVASSVECYISEHGVTGDVAIAKIGSMIEDAWKTTNHARFELAKLFPAVQLVANVSISMWFMYANQKDSFTFSNGLDRTIRSLFVNPIRF
ncbi:hypothetical protein QYE76_003280 [Lolium multiflorum]|uniref:Uncharacterized protein n=1 Tax=Lolium multiflorum TaxID=4521 RepID=A0AAD8VYP5_LOLMU|nr:hypothetical protein QYE76_003280 [Lolium multiflorum]